MMLNILQSTKQPHNKDDPTQNVSSAKAEQYFCAQLVRLSISLMSFLLY
jgi:hypothetical protein